MAEQLAPEIWEIIFTNLKCLKVVRLTCRRFRDIVNNCPVLRERFRVFFNDEFIMDHRYNPLPLPLVAEARFYGSKVVDVSAWWPGFGSTLTELYLQECEHFPLKILRFTPNLVKLDTFKGSLDVRGSDVELNFKLEKLDKLVLAYESAKVLNAVKRIVPMSLTTFVLNLNDHEMYDDQAGPSLVKFVEMWQDSLKKLQLPAITRVLDAIALLPRLKLTEVRVVESEICYIDRRINLPGLVRLARAQPSLEKLELRVALDGPTQHALYPALPNLKSFLAYYCDMESFSASMTDLECLELVQLKLPIEAGNVSYRLTKLKHLLISNVQVEGDSLTNILRNSSTLCTVKLYNCDFDSFTQLLLAISPSHSLKDLTLILSKWKTIGDSNSVPMFQPVTSISLMGAPGGDEMISILVSKLPSLENLSLTGCSTTDQSARIILEHRFALKRLEINDDWNLTKRAYNRIRAELDEQGTEFEYSRHLVKQRRVAKSVYSLEKKLARQH